MNAKKVPKSSAQLRYEAGILRIINLKKAGLWLDKSPIEEKRWPSIGPIRPILGGENSMGWIDWKLLLTTTSPKNQKMWYQRPPRGDDTELDDTKATVIQVYSFRPDPINWMDEVMKFWMDKKRKKGEEEDSDPWGDIDNEDEDGGDDDE